MSVVVHKIGAFYRDLVTLDLKRRLKECSDVFLLNYHKMPSAEMTQLRRELKQVGASVLVTKNSFMRKVFEETKKPAPAMNMVDGPMALIFIKNDPVATSKVLMKFAKDHEALQVRGGFMAERTVSVDDIQFISKLASQQSVYQQIASTLSAPVSKLAMGLNQILAKLVYAVKAVSEKKK